jgi:hypothetical protein
MSGPKVVRIVTREEILALCEGHLARVDAAMREWLRIGRRNDCVSDADVAQAEGRMARLRALLTADRFLDLQKQAPHEIAFLHQDMQARLAKVADAATKARSASRRQGEAASALLAALRRKGAALAPDLEAALNRAAEGQPDPQALSRGFALLSAEAVPDATSRRALAQSLKDGGNGATLADWIAAQPAMTSDPVLERFEGRLAELSLLAGARETDAFETRLSVATSPDAEPRRSLLLDSLDLDLTAALLAARQREILAQDLRLTLAELTLVDAAAARTIAARAERPDADQVALLADAQASLAKAQDVLAAQARRAAVLRSLAGLGYEVGERLATAWVDQGRVVLRKAAQPDYGVEISGDPAGARMQMRVVAFGDESAADAARDQDAETQWCGDVAMLESTLAAAGGGLVIERALAVGATPVKRVAAPAGALSRVAREGPAQQTRSRS